MRKARLIKVAIGSFAATFLCIQLIGSANLRSGASAPDLITIVPPPSLVNVSSSATSLQKVSRGDSIGQDKPKVVVAEEEIIPEAAKFEVKYPIDPAAVVKVEVKTEALKAEAKEAKESKEAKETDDSGATIIKDASKSSLSGDARIHELPNDTNSHAKPLMSNTNITRILTRIKEINEEQSVRNEDLFGPVNNTTVVLVIQVHNRLQYLRQLIISLSQASGIDNTLIIFSHDFWDDKINDLVNSVDFAKTMQIFYPFSIQTHPSEFPGESVEDCPRNAKKDQ